MSLNIPNLDRLISYLEALPPEEFNMQYPEKSDHPCGSACCIMGHIKFLSNGEWCGPHGFLSDDMSSKMARNIVMPEGYENEEDGNKAYPLSRALRMLKRLRAEFLRTGKVVVDWDAPEAVETSRKPWAPPVVIGADKPLPSSLTSLLREPEASAPSLSAEG